MNNKFSIHSPLLHVILYSMLLIATPFIMLQHYLQEFIGSLSRYSYNIGSTEIAWLPTIAFVLMALIIFLIRRYITLYRFISFLIVVALFAMGQMISDYYFDHTFYDLQHNWHYFAYGIFVFMLWRVFKDKDIKYPKLIFRTYFIAIALSSFDEFFQMHLSNRVFDIGDIAKDSWGVCIGMIFVFFIIEQGKLLKNNDGVLQRKLSDYRRNPLSALYICLLFGYILLFFSSILTNIEYLGIAILISICAFILVFIIVHLMQFKISRIVLISLIAVTVLFTGYTVIKSENRVEYVKPGLIKYYGIPVPYFDFLIHSNGVPRLVDKKLSFNQRDKIFLKRNAKDIVIIGAGSEFQGGKGFPEQRMAQFIFSPYTKKGLQVIVLRNQEAIFEYNRIKSEGKNPMLIIYNG